MSKFDQWFVAGWRHSWAWFSIHMHIIGASALGMVLLAPSLPDEVQAIVPLKWRVLVLAAWSFLGLFARLKKQGDS